MSPLLHHHRTITAPSPHHHRTITAPSPHHHRTITAPGCHFLFNDGADNYTLGSLIEGREGAVTVQCGCCDGAVMVQ